MAKTAVEILNMVNNGNYTIEPFIQKWRDIYLRMSIHTTGVCPSFRPLRQGKTGYYVAPNSEYIYPAWWISSSYDYIFNTFLLNRHPREPEEIRELRKSMYRPYQTAPLLECINSLKACIFGDSKYTLTVEDQSDMDYIYGQNFDGKTFIGYFEWMFKAICEDPNSLFFVVPRKHRRETGSQVEPKIMHIPSTQIVYITDTEVVFFEPFTDNGIGWWVTETGYFRFKKNTEGKYEFEDGLQDGWYHHALYKMPIHFAGGIWNTLRYYDSYLKAAQPFCDDFVSAQSDVQLVNKDAAFPFIQMVQEDCPTCNQQGEYMWCENCHSKRTQCECGEEAKLHVVTCATCDGAKYLTSFNPGQRVFVPKSEADRELIKIVNFDINVNKHFQETADAIKEGIKSSLHQQYIKEAQSGKAKEIDREAEYLYRAMVSNGIWNGLIKPIFIDILSLRHMPSNGAERKPDLPRYEIVPPTDFALKTEFEILGEIAESQKAKMPEYIIKRQTESYVDKVYGGSDVMKKKTAIINQMDNYAVTPLLDKSALLSAGNITIDDFTFSNSLPNIIDAIVREKGSEWFLYASYEQIETICKDKYKSVEKPQPVQPTETINKTETVV